MKKLGIAVSLALTLLLNASLPLAGVLATDGSSTDRSNTAAVMNEVDAAFATTQANIMTADETESPAEVADERIIDGIASLAELYNRVQYSEAFDDYRAREGFLIGMGMFANPLLQPVSTILNNNSQGQKWYDNLSDTTKAAIKNTWTVLALNSLRQDPLYRSNQYFKDAVDWLVATLSSAIKYTLPQMLIDYPDNAMLQQLSEQLKDESASVSVNIITYLQLAVATPNYATYAVIYDIERDFIVKSNREGDLEISQDAMKQEFSAVQLVALFEEYAAWVQEIEPSLLNNLPFYENVSNVNDDEVDEPSDNKRPQNPTIGDNTLTDLAAADEDIEDVKVRIPDTGALGLHENELNDLGMIIIVASTIVAAVFGAMMVARLYLRHKMKF